jgi:hypothetical protein
LAFEHQCRQASLGLTDEVDRQEPSGQRQLRTREQGACDLRRLVMAGIALIPLPRLTAQHAMRIATAAQTEKSIGPARPTKNVCAGRLAPKALEKLRQRHAVLELNGVVRHGATPQ